MKKLVPRLKKPVSSHASVPKKALEHRSVNSSETILGVEECIQGSQVNLETASKFCKKSWSIYSQLVSDHVSQVSTDRYDLSERLLRTTRNCLEERSKEVKAYLSSGYKAADILAEALCRSAQEVGPPPEEPDDSSDYWVSGTPIWGADHAILEAWSGLGPLQVPGDAEASLKLAADTGKWAVGPARLGIEIHDVSYEETQPAKTGFFSTPAPPAPDYTDPSVVRIVRSFEKQKNFLPKLTIEVEGAPVCLLMQAFHLQLGGKAAPKEAEKLWNSIVSWLAMSMGIKRAKPGRPPMGQGWEAAYAYYHEGLSWPKVARKLCPQQHQHDHNCRENFRKQAEQYLKRLRRKFAQPSRSAK